MHTFDGDTFINQRDGVRLSAQLERVLAVMKDQEWHDLPELVQKCGGTAASISARVRDFRKERFGGHTVNTSYVSKGLWRYQLVMR
jgi:hypothetical protein